MILARIGVLIALAVVVAGISLLVGWAIFRARPKGRPVQFTLRRLLIVMALVAVALGMWLSGQEFFRADLVWLKSGTPEAEALFPSPTIVREDESYFAVFRPRYRDSQEFMAMRPPHCGEISIPGFSTADGAQGIRLGTSDEEYLNSWLAEWRQADVLQPGWFVINGIVEDGKDRPVAGAIVDLMGPYVYINHFTTRSDGTFTMPIQAPPNRGYYLRIRCGDGQRMRTRSFRLDPAVPEMVARIRVR